ncbi:hypothetical protein [Pseudoduganella albidiflava]|uniref:DUF416 family protein n=1 Tax=Pseudoduganella albidiflava TaxID=321983 RepID=A0A411WS70_9BURK|nr:hypothetical protein [Pseudoduganella albidiflava]QBH99491.1 hypothetical protein EYF70_00545 [Pseudoduganella albidiflava]GGY45281.1 hypothetical protein GCM10007387_29100 [Pseudoduganella albidiflava]
MIFRETELYVALKCIGRLLLNLESRKLTVPAEISLFVEDLWLVLRGQKNRVALTKIDRKIERLIVDEQDAGFEESLVNRGYYALSCLILYLQEGHSLSIQHILEEALESFRYEAANDYLNALGGLAMVLSDSEEDEIEADTRVSSEKEKQSEDKYLAGKIVDWANVIR